MIEYLHGSVISKDEKGVVLDINGVGYRVFLSAKVLSLVSKGDDAEFFTYLAVREDAQDLYGFMNEEELDFFKLLIGTSGVGPKMALNIMNASSMNDLKGAIASGDSGILTAVSGVGKKTAERVIIELKGKVEKMGFADDGSKIDMEEHEGAMEALVGLGYSPRDAQAALSGIDPKMDMGEKVKQALKNLSS